MSYAIRTATVDDVDAIVRVLVETKIACLPAVTEHDRNVPFWGERWRYYIEHGSTAQMATGDGFVFLAESDGEPVGFAAYHHTKRHDTDAELQSMYVLQSAQGQGIGSALLRLIGSRLVADGSRSLCVGYSPDNPYRRFYSKHGAVEINPHWAVWQDITKIV